MTDRIIRRDDSSFTISEIMPSGWEETDIAVDVSVTDLDGNVIVDDEAATVYAGDVVDGDADGGQKDIVLTTGNAVTEGQVLIIGSAAAGFHEMTVDDYIASTKTVTFTDFLPEDIPDLSKVYGRDMTYALDASTSDWETIKQVTVEWIPDTDDMPMAELWQVLDRDSRIGGLQAHFIKRYSKFKNVIGENWMTFENDAWVRVRNIFDLDNRNLDRVIVNRTLEPLVLLQIALLCCYDNPTKYETDIDIYKAEFNEQLGIVQKMRIWDDSNQDKIKTEDEYQPAVQTGLERGL